MVQRAKLLVLPVRQDRHYCSYDVNCCLSVWHVRVRNAANFTCLACCLTIQEGVPEDAEESTYVGRAKLQSNTSQN